MSTRSVVVITGLTTVSKDNVPSIEEQKKGVNGTRTIRIYKHCDGYPTGNLNVIAETLLALKKSYTPNRAAHSFCEIAGGSTRIDEEYYNGKQDGFAIYDTDVKAKHFGGQGDVEWSYLLDLEKKQVKVFSRLKDWTKDDRPSDMFSRSPIDPLSYVFELYEEYQEAEKEHIKESIRKIEEFGFTVN